MTVSTAERRAVFLDRDGTLIHDANYLSRPEQLRFLSDVPTGLRRLSEAGLALVVITNQSGIGRRYFTEADFAEVTRALDAMLAGHGVHLMATYHCPDAPDVPPELSCRKPSPRLYERAAQEHGLSLTRSFYVGDRWRDVQPAVTLNGTGILIPTASTSYTDMMRAREHALVATSFTAAVDRIISRLERTS
jgi:D-glycero-D-manno-heptose 1,7-bisphosphate phosphatase